MGGGFGGLFATRALGWSPVDVTLVDREPHHLFQPMLYQVATGIVSEGEIAPSLRHVLRFQENAAVLLAEVTGFDLQARVVKARRPDGTPIAIPYDSLIVAAGAGVSYFGHDELAEHAPGMKTLDDALRLRRRLLQALEMAELTEDPERQAALVDGGHRRRRPHRRRDRRSDHGRWRCARSAPASGGSIRRRCGCCCSTRARSRCTSSAIGCRRSPRASSASWGSSCAWASR